MLTQAALLTAVATRVGITQTAVAAVLGAVAEEVQTALGKGEEVTLPHLGKLKPVTRAARDGRNPRTGEPVKIPAKIAVKFSAAKDLRDSLPTPKPKK